MAFVQGEENVLNVVFVFIGTISNCTSIAITASHRYKEPLAAVIVSN